MGNAVVMDLLYLVVSWYECRYLNSGWRCRGFVDFIFEAERIVFLGCGWTDGRTGLCDSDVISGTGFFFVLR